MADRLADPQRPSVRAIFWDNDGVLVETEHLSATPTATVVQQPRKPPLLRIRDAHSPKDRRTLRARLAQSEAEVLFYNKAMRRSTSRLRRPRRTSTPAARLEEAERLFADFVELTPYRYRPFVKTFDSFAEYERWKRAQTNPWYR